ncbi:MAG: A/G-specific adenine glycosylase [Isosphaeraceae bacterium]
MSDNHKLGVSAGGRLESDARWVDAVREKLAAWYLEVRRDLPWRNDCDPYRILVSEMMLVQTTVAAVIPYFERFLRRFPDVAALAAADPAEVLKAWEGLGYYRRARQLHAAARQLVQLHGGVMPDDPAAIRNLPGVGRYIAGAILSFAFDRPEPIVEANSQRVLARILAVDGNLAVASTREQIWSAAARLVPTTGAGSFNQALIELGALVCTPREPSCLICPLASVCNGRRLGIQDRLPVTLAKTPPLSVTEVCVILVRNERVLIVQRGVGGLWEQFWEFPTLHVDGANPAGRRVAPAVDLAEGIRHLTGVEARIGQPLTTLKYSVTNHRVKLIARVGQALDGIARAGPGLVDARWALPIELSEYTFSSAGRRLIEWIRQDPSRLQPELPTAAAKRGSARKPRGYGGSGAAQK